jgi:CAAX protease family protein
MVWGSWHFPLHANGQYREAPMMVFAKAGACMLIAIPFTWLYNRIAGNLLPAVVLHTAFNNTPRIIPTTAQMGPVMLAIFAAMVLYLTQAIIVSVGGIRGHGPGQGTRRTRAA